MCLKLAGMNLGWKELSFFSSLLASQMLESAKAYGVWDLCFVSVAFPNFPYLHIGDFVGNDRRKATWNHNEKINQQYSIMKVMEVKNVSYE